MLFAIFCSRLPKVPIATHSQPLGKGGCRVNNSSKVSFNDLPVLSGSPSQVMGSLSYAEHYTLADAELDERDGSYCDAVIKDMPTPASTLITIEAAVRPVVSFTPNWGKILKGESITLTCNVDPREQGVRWYYWYKDGRLINEYKKTYTIKEAQRHNGGNYQCQTRTSERSDSSDSLRLDVSDDWVILQAPPSVYEGDNLTLRCHHRPSYEAESPVFYKDESYIGGPVTDSIIQIGIVDKSTAGTYTCEKIIHFTFSVSRYTGKAWIAVKDLFSDPELRVSPDQVTEGDDMTLTCVTDLALLRDDTRLQFAFYRNEQKVQGFGESSVCRVYSAQLDLSGSYTCQVQTTTNTVTKTSGKRDIVLSAHMMAGPVFTGRLPRRNQLSSPAGVSIGCQGRPLALNPSFLEAPLIRPRVSTNLKPPGGPVMAGQMLEVTCSVDRETGPFEFHWCRQEPESCLTKPRSGPRQVVFVVESVEETYMGDYYCAILLSKIQTLIRGEAVRISVTVPVTGARLRADREVLEMMPGHNVTFTCSVEQGTSPSFLWRHNGQEVGNESELYQIRESGRELSIESVQPQHGGTYQCEATNQLSPNRTFSVDSNILTISISEKTSAFLGPLISFFVLLSILIPAILVFKCRQKLPLPLVKSHQGRPMTEAGVRPVVSFTPNWGKILKGESITLTCNVDPREQGGQWYYWYKDGWFINEYKKTYTIKEAQRHNGGNYQCQTRTSERSDSSDSLRLDVRNDWVILQAPPSVYEGDNMTLRCHHRTSYEAESPVFYKDERYIGG
ncbi:Fc receptor-like A [Pelodytes ibericus]